LNSQDTGSGKAFSGLIRRALQVYHQDEALESLELLGQLHLVRLELERASGQNRADAVRGIIRAGLESLRQMDPEAAAILEARYLDKKLATMVAMDRNYGVRTLYKRQGRAITVLAQIIWAQEERERDRRQRVQTLREEAILNSLPPPTYTRLFGVAATLEHLIEFLAAEQRYWLVAVEGLGGIGKTALARQAVEGLVRAGRFHFVFWITARQQYFRWGAADHESRPALSMVTLLDELSDALQLDTVADSAATGAICRLRTALSTRSALIVVDNLETAADVESLLASLDALARPTKILITTRKQVRAYPQITPLSLNELPPRDALAFIRHYAQERNIEAVKSAPVDYLDRIVSVTSGHPLAIKLVLGQMHMHPIDVVLTNLVQVRNSSHDFYNFVYRWAWDSLSSIAKQLFIHIPLLDISGFCRDDLQGISGMSDQNDLEAAIEELLATSLLNVGLKQGNLMYSIHRLTEYFILSDLLGDDLASALS